MDIEAPRVRDGDLQQLQVTSGGLGSCWNASLMIRIIHHESARTWSAFKWPGMSRLARSRSAALFATTAHFFARHCVDCD